MLDLWQSFEIIFPNSKEMFTAGGVQLSGHFADRKLRTTEEIQDGVWEKQESGHDTYVQGILGSLGL